MGSFVTKLLDTSDYPARWHCGLWTPFEGWLHIVSDLLIFGAYTAIPLVILYFRRRQRDVAFGPVYWMFCVFIFSCGATHLIEAVIFWEPIYRIGGVVKAITAAASWATVGALVLLLPEALRMPGRAAISNQLAREVQARRRTQAEVEQRNVELEHFASVASHDLREPLRKISFFADQLRQDPDNRLSPESVESLAILGSAVERSQQLIQGLLTFSRLGRIEEVDRAVDLLALCRDLVQDRALTDPELTIEVRGSAPPVPGDPRLLRELLENLVGNAAKYRSPLRPPVVTIELGTAPGGGARVVVADNGIGLDPADAERIFLPFERLHSRERYPGTGMGLAICRRIAEAHGGQITASGVPDVGTRFTLDLPGADHAEHDGP